MIALYRLFNLKKELLYVGVSGRPQKRLKEHKGDKTWGGEIVTMESLDFPSRDDARIAERAAVVSEIPKYNGNLYKIHSPKAPRKNAAQHYLQGIPIAFRPPDSVRRALEKRRKAGENVSQVIVAAIRRFLKIK